MINLSEPSERDKKIAQLASDMDGSTLAVRTATALYEDGITSMDVMINLLRVLGRDEFRERITLIRNVGDKSMTLISGALNRYPWSGRSEDEPGLPATSLARLREAYFQSTYQDVLGEELLFPGLKNRQGEECGATVYDFRLLIELLTGL